MKRNSSRKVRSTEVHLGFQIAPMIDVVFVILLYFMVVAGDAKVEMVNQAQLPGGQVDPEHLISCPDEIAIRIEDDGQIFLNDDPLDSPQSRTLPELVGNLGQLKQSSQASSSPLLVTIQASELSRYQRVMDVLDALNLANITNVTFQAGEF